MTRLKLLAFALALFTSATSVAGTLARPPYLVLQDGLPTLVWETDEEAPTVLRYGSTPGMLRFEFNDPQPTRQHAVALRGLEPSTAYFYAVGTGDGELLEQPEFYFLSPPRSASPSRLVSMPRIEELSPGPGEEGVAADVAVEVRLRDDGPGIAPEGIELIVDGVHVQAAVGGTPHARYVYWKPESPFVAGAVVQVEVHARNVDGVEMAPTRASFGVTLDALAYEDDVMEPEAAPSANEVVLNGQPPTGYSCSTAGAQPASLALLAALLLLRRGFACAQASMARLRGFVNRPGRRSSSHDETQRPV